MTDIHNTAIINPKAKIGDNVSIGPYCNIDGDVTIRDNVTLVSHISISGSTTIGENTKIWPFSVIGSEPQDLKHNSEEGKLIIGANNKIREHVTMHSGTKEGGMLTKIGENNLNTDQVWLLTRPESDSQRVLWMDDKPVKLRLIEEGFVNPD